jgi:CheY-like chemotaxis protein
MSGVHQPLETRSASTRVPDAVDTAFKLLYIEDSPSHIKLVEAIFARENDIQLYTANTPHLGLEMVQAYNPDLILLDICLPGMDGYQVFAQLSENATTRHIPVIALSAGAMPQEIEKALRSGFRRYLTKPVDIGELLRAVKEVLRGGRVADLKN